MRKLLILLIISFALMFSGCAKVLNPGATEFKCPANGTGVCANVTTVYQNRHNIDSLKYKDLPDLKTYVEEKCAFLKNSVTNEADGLGNTEYDDCVYRATSEWKKNAETKRNEQKGVNIQGKGNEALYSALRADEGIPLRQPDQVMSIWFAPYKNDNGDLVYSHYVYAVRKKSDWLFVPESEQVKILKQSKEFNPLIPYLPESKTIK